VELWAATVVLGAQLEIMQILVLVVAARVVTLVLEVLAAAPLVRRVLLEQVAVAVAAVVELLHTHAAYRPVKLVVAVGELVF
jgi:hypothetical protein